MELLTQVRQARHRRCPRCSSRCVQRVGLWKTSPLPKSRTRPSPGGERWILPLLLGAADERKALQRGSYQRSNACWVWSNSVEPSPACFARADSRWLNLPLTSGSGGSDGENQILAFEVLLSLGRPGAIAAEKQAAVSMWRTRPRSRTCSYPVRCSAPRDTAWRHPNMPNCKGKARARGPLT